MHYKFIAAAFLACLNMVGEVGACHRDCLLFGDSGEGEFLCSKALLYLAIEENGDI